MTNIFENYKNLEVTSTDKWNVIVNPDQGRIHLLNVFIDKERGQYLSVAIDPKTDAGYFVSLMEHASSISSSDYVRRDELDSMVRDITKKSAEQGMTAYKGQSKR